MSTSNDAAQPWLSVKDGLPPLHKAVLVYPAPTDYCREAEYTRKGWYYGEYLMGHGHENLPCDPTHWMPMPLTPTGEVWE